MSKSEQEALLAFFSTFKIKTTRQSNVFGSLADGRRLMEVMSQIDETHFKPTPTRAGAGAGAGPSENWVLKMNYMKRLYRSLLSYPLPEPQQSLSQSSLPEPNFSAVARSPTSPDGLSGLTQICKFCLCISVWASGNEKVVHKIQTLDAKVQEELMRCINEVSATLPLAEGEAEGMASQMQARGSKRTSPEKRSIAQAESSKPGTPPSGIRAERDRLIRDLEELRGRYSTLETELSDTATAYETARQEKEDALARLVAAREASASGLRTSQSASSEVDRLRNDLGIAEENVHRAEGELAKQTALIKDLTRQLDELKPKAEEASKLRDQLDEHRHLAERLQKNENVIEKYKKKLDESASLRRDYKRLEEENSQMTNTISSLESQQRKSGQTSGSPDLQVVLEKMAESSALQSQEIERVTLESELVRQQLEKAQLEHERDKEELQDLRDRLREVDLAGLNRVSSSASIPVVQTLDAELESAATPPGDTKASLTLLVKALEQELKDLKLGSGDQQEAAILNNLLADAITSRDTYQADYLSAHRERSRLRLQVDAYKKCWDQLLNPHLVPMTREQRDSFNDQQFASNADRDRSLKATLLDSGMSTTSVNYLRSIYDLNPELGSRLRAPRTSKETVIEFSQLSEALKSREPGLTTDVLAYLEEVHRWNSDFRDRLLRSYASVHAQLKAKEPGPEATIPQSVDGPSDIFEPGAGHLAESEMESSHQKRIADLVAELEKYKQLSARAAENPYPFETRLMTSALHHLGSQTAEKYLSNVVAGVKRGGASRPTPMGWLGKQRRYQAEAIYARG